jgi:hypothetical protein
MTTLIRLNDLQLVLLANAAQRDNGSLLPLPDNGTHDTSHIGRAIASLIRRKFVEERMVTDRALTWLEGNEECFGLFITEAGRAAVWIEPDDADGKPEADDASSPATEAPIADALSECEPDDAAPSAPSKIGIVIALLRRDEGATLAELAAATQWLPHTTRAALTGLRKKGHAIGKSKREGATCYHLADVTGPCA